MIVIHTAFSRVLYCSRFWCVFSRRKGTTLRIGPVSRGVLAVGMKEAAMGRFRALLQVTGVMQFMLRVLSECCWLVALHTMVCVFVQRVCIACSAHPCISCSIPPRCVKRLLFCFALWYFGLGGWVLCSSTQASSSQGWHWVGCGCEVLCWYVLCACWALYVLSQSGPVV
jgi:hypothetical protein